MQKKAAFILISLLLASCSLDTPPSNDSDSGRSIGFVGCSNSRQTFYGYRFAGGTKMWKVDMHNLHDYDSGSVLAWAEDTSSDNEYWQVFDQHMQQNPNTNKIWLQLCIPRGDAAITYKQAYPIIENLRRKIPGVQIYVSPLAEYTTHVCEITGTEGIERGKTLARELDEQNEDVHPGPAVGPLSIAQIMTQEQDRCHPNEEGMRKMGEQLRNFFEKFDEMNSTPEAIEAAGEHNDSSETEEVIQDKEVKIEEPKPLSVKEQHWKRVFGKAFEPVDCPKARDPKTIPDGYYKGPMFDAHIHIHSLPDGDPGFPDDFYTGENVGTKRSMDEWVCMMDSEGTSKALAFFAVWDPIRKESVDLVNMTLKKYPGRFIPFIMPPDDDGNVDGFPTVDASTLDEMLRVYPGLFQGYGEIGLYERPNGTPALSPDSTRLTEIYPVARKNNLIVYFHLGEGQKKAFEKVLAANPDITFIFHGDQLIQCDACDGTLDDVADILENHPNVYYGVDELYGDVFLLNDKHTKEEFIAHFKDYDPLLAKDVRTWKKFIEEHPDQVLWDTDRGVGPPWSLDHEVAITLNNYSRAFIGRLDPAVQEKYAYKNAEKLFSKDKSRSPGQVSQNKNTKPVLKNLGINIQPLDKTTHKAGDFLFDHKNYVDNKIFTEFAHHIVNDRGEKLLPEIGFNVPVGTKVVSPMNGILTEVKLYEPSQDYILFMKTDTSSSWIVGFEHVYNVKPKAGDRVVVGQEIAEVSPSYGRTEFGNVEINVWTAGQNIIKYCPFEFLDESLKPIYEQKIRRLAQDWEEFIGKDVYDENAWVAPGCLRHNLTER